MLSQIILVALGLISRKVFINSLGAEYLGINGLLTNVLSMLSLVESGIGVSIVYHLYKPLAEGNKKEIIALVQLYKRLYSALAILVLVLSLVIYPIVIRVIGDEKDLLYISIVYFIFVARNIISYLYAHKWSLIGADQKGYVLDGIKIGFNVVTLIARIIILKLTQSYIIYLMAEIILLVIQNIYNGRIVDKRYPYIKTKEKYKIANEVRKNIIKNVKALFLHNIGGYIVNGTDNLLIGGLISVKVVGLYANYTLIINQLAMLLSPILGGINASVGNLIALEKKEKKYSIFKVTYLVNFWMYSVMVIFLFNLLEPFINWWIGEGYLLDRKTYYIVLFNFYMMGMRISISTFKHKAGIFAEDRYVPLIEAALNLGASLLFVQWIGLAGVFLGTTLSTLATVFWNVPRLVYKHVFNEPVRHYFITYFFYAGLTLVVLFLTTFVCTRVGEGKGLMTLVLKGIVCISLPNLIYITIFFKTDEFKYLYNVFKAGISHFRGLLLKNISC